jgi:hypothetical protein
LISEGQRKRLFAMAREHGVATDALKDFVFKQFAFSSTKDVTAKSYEAICKWIQKGGAQAS